MNTNKYSRQGNLVDSGTPKKIAIFGVGNVGSYAALLCAKMGLSNIVLVDDDTVEIENTSTQLFGENDIDKLKTVACAELIESLAAIKPEIATISDQPRIYADIIILAIDSIEGRIKAIEETRASCDQYIDARQGALNVEIITGSADYLLDNLKNTEISPNASSCSAKGISFNSAITGALVANEVRRGLISRLANRFFRLDINNSFIFKSKNYDQANATS